MSATVVVLVARRTAWASPPIVFVLVDSSCLYCKPCCTPCTPDTCTPYTLKLVTANLLFGASICEQLVHTKSAQN